MRRPQDEVLDRRVVHLQQRVEKWARQNDLWDDCEFSDYIERVAPVEWDGAGYVTALTAGGPLAGLVIGRTLGDGRFGEEFDQILQEHGFWYETRDYTELWIYAVDPRFECQFREYTRWKWICSLIKPDFDILDQELYDYFGRRSDELANLNWRDFEKIVAALMESQGYEVELGPGRSDGGVDIRLMQRDPIGDIMTLVQVKRYRADRKIALEAVQALHGAATAEEAEGSMFVTTSSYLPSAERFAARGNVEMLLRTSEDVRNWCWQAHRGIVEDKRKLIGQGHVSEAVRQARRNPRRILHAHTGYSVRTNDFAIVLKETPSAALLLRIENKITEHDGYRQRGCELPDIETIPPLGGMGRSAIKRVRRMAGPESPRFWDGDHIYSPWDGNAAHFDLCD